MTDIFFYRLVSVVVFVSSMAALFINVNFAWISIFFALHLFQYTYTKFCILKKVWKPKKEDAPQA